MPSVKGHIKILLQPGDTDLTWKFNAPPASTESANDGAIPYNTSVVSVSVKSYDEDGTEVTDLIQGNPSVSNNVVSITMSYPSTSGAGKYKITCIMTLNTGGTVEWDYNRIEARNL